MSRIVEVVPLMTPEEREQAKEIDSRSPHGFKIDYLLTEGDAPLRVEVIPDNIDDANIDLPYGLKVFDRKMGNEVFRHPNSFIGILAVRETLLSGSLDAAYAASEAS